MEYNFPVTRLTLPSKEYVEEKTQKKMIMLHHSAGWDNVRGMFEDWANRPGRVATALGLNDEGQIFEAFDPWYWAYHIYIRSRGNKLPEHLLYYKESASKAIYLEKITVGIEIANFGPLKYRNGVYYAWPNDYGTRGKGVEIPEDKVYDFGVPFRGHRFYERYTDSEVGALKVLLKELGAEFNIPMEINGDIFDVNQNFFEEKPGIYTHCSARTDKTDVVPQQHLVDMLNSL